MHDTTIDVGEKDIGRRVTYKGPPVEVGVITSFNSQYVFVRYGDEKHAKGTKPEDIHYTDKPHRPGV